MFKKLILISFCAALIAGCYRIPIQQGNIIPADAAQSIHNGMTKQQVEQTLGLPVLINPYADNQMTYVYTFKPNIGMAHLTRLIIYFNNGLVVNTSYVTAEGQKAIL